MDVPAERERLARRILAPLLALLLVAAALCPWHTPFCVDNRTYLEMTEGVLRRGVPTVTNGPVQRFPELQLRWNALHRGRLWGSYAPIYPYVAAPLMRLGGPRLVVQGNVALLAALALGAYALGRRLTRDPVAGAAAAWLTLAGTHVWTFSFDVSPYSWMLTLNTASVALAAGAVDEGGRRGFARAFGAGLAGALAAFAHLLSLPSLAVVVALLAWLRADGEDPLLAAPWPTLAPWVPSRQSLARGALAALGAALVTAPVMALNRVRFGTASPMSTGACVWWNCPTSNLPRQGLGAMLRFNAPLFAWAAVTAAVLWSVRRSRASMAVVGAVALAALAVPSALHDAAFGMSRLFMAFVVDLSRLDLGFHRPADGLGQMLGPFAVKSLLQCAPVLALALAPSIIGDHARRVAVAVALPACALLGSLLLRGEVTLVFAVGFPFLDLRYVTPSLPLLAAFATLSLRALPWRPRHLAALVALAALFLAWARYTDNDLSFARRVVLLRGTLLAAALAFVCAVRARTQPSPRATSAAMATALVAAALSVGVCLGVDLPAWAAERNRHDAFSDRVAALTPPRFAVIGLAGPFAVSEIAALRATRDVQYVDVEEVGLHLERLRGLVDHWEAEKRPIFVVMPPGFVSPWSDYQVVPVDPKINLTALRRR